MKKPLDSFQSFLALERRKEKKKLGKEKEIEEKLEHESSFHFLFFKERHLTASRVYH